MQNREKEILEFQVQRTINALCKNFLTLIEDLQAEYDRYFEHNQPYSSDTSEDSSRPPEMFLNQGHFEHLRKRILDKGGDAMRNLLQELEKYQIKLLANEDL